MKLYLFEISDCYGKEPKLIKKEYEVVEKSKTYVDVEFHRRFRKEDIGCCSGFYRNECLLLEDNPSMAAGILLGMRNAEIEGLRAKIEKEQAKVDLLKVYMEAGGVL